MERPPLTDGTAAYVELSQLALDLGAARNLPDVYGRLRRFVESQTPMSGMFVSSYDADSRLRTCEYAYSEGEELDASTFPPMPNTGSPHSRAVETGETILTQDFQEAMAGKPRMNVGLDRDPSLPQSSLVVALRAGGAVLGAMEIQSTQPRAFTPDHVATLQLAAHLAALAAENVRLVQSERHAKEESERRAADLEVKMRDRHRELASKNRELEAFSFTAAHDLRAPLRAILSLSEDLLVREKDRLTDRGKANLEAVHQSSVKMASLVDDLLQFARMSQGTVKRDLVDMTSLARAAVADLGAREKARQTDIHVQENLYVEADPTLVRVLVDNLIGNAWKYSVGKPVTTIRVGARIEKGELVYFVEDRGIGFDEGDASRLFLAFERLAPAAVEGTGLGLATARRIVERHGGRIWATAVKGEGSTFSFTLSPPRTST